MVKTGDFKLNERALSTFCSSTDGLVIVTRANSFQLITWLILGFQKSWQTTMQNERKMSLKKFYLYKYENNKNIEWL